MSEVTLLPRVLGTPASHDGAFGYAEQRAAEHYGAEHTYFMVNGSTGCNFVVLRALALSRPGAPLLLTRSSHHSVINACNVLGIPFAFVPSCGYDAEFEAFLPPTPGEIAAALAKHPDAMGVYITSPTYEGLVAHVGEIADVVHRHSSDCVLAVDEAWGAHLGAHPALPGSAIRSGADVCVQSAHKVGGALQQTALLHWTGERIEKALIDQAYRELVTTSPSFSLLASIESAVLMLDQYGEELLGETIERATELLTHVVERLPRIRPFPSPEWLTTRREQVAAVDPVKVTFGLSGYEATGFEVRDALLAQDVVVEKAAINTVTFLVPFQIKDRAIGRAVRAIGDFLEERELPAGAGDRVVPDPITAVDDDPALPPFAVTRHASSFARDESVDAAAGLVCAEQVEVYPPGIPILLEGFVIRREALDYIERVVAAGGRVSGRERLTTVRVLPADFSRGWMDA